MEFKVGDRVRHEELGYGKVVGFDKGSWIYVAYDEVISKKYTRATASLLDKNKPYDENIFKYIEEDRLYYCYKEILEKVDFTKYNLLPFYVVELRDGSMGMVVTTEEENYIVLDGGGWIGLEEYSNYLTYDCVEEVDIIKVYGYSNCKNKSLEISTENRELLWERKEVKKLTYEQLRNELGFDFEIVESE